MPRDDELSSRKQSYSGRLGGSDLLACAVLPVLLTLVALWVGGCGKAPAPAAGAGSPRPLDVVATTGMIADIASRIAGERATVHGLMGEGVDPHLYKASPGDMRLLGDADLVLYNGLHLEGRMADALERLGERVPTVRVTERIPPERLRKPAEFDGEYDPHVWFDVGLWAMAAERIRDALIEADPDGAEGHRARAADLLVELGELDAWCRSQLASVPKDRRILVTAHDAFGYFGRAYEVEVLAIQGISTDSEASLRGLNQLVDTIVARGVPAVFVESSVPPKTVESLIEGCKAKGHAVRMGGELYSDAVGKTGTPEGTYVGMVRHNVRTIVGALGASPIASPSSGKQAGDG